MHGFVVEAGEDAEGEAEGGDEGEEGGRGIDDAVCLQVWDHHYFFLSSSNCFPMAICSEMYPI